METLAQIHLPVMLDTCIDLLYPGLEARDAVYVDATTGMGGHLAAVLSRFPHVRAIAIDRDEEALRIAARRLGEAAERCTFVHTTYDRIGEVVARARVGGILMDLGVSSYQLDERERGFSYARDAALDMRMDTSQPVTAADLLATCSAAELTRILATYGEERYASRIARGIVAERGVRAVRSSEQLVRIIRESLPSAAMRRGGNPAKRTFQALRIAVNAELDILERALPAALDVLAPGGRLVVESYHSLEDRLVKRAFRDATRSDLPDRLPVVEADRGADFTLLTPKALKAPAEERAANPRSSSVRVRAVGRNGS